MPEASLQPPISVPKATQARRGEGEFFAFIEFLANSNDYARLAASLMSDREQANAAIATAEAALGAATAARADATADAEANAIARQEIGDARRRLSNDLASHQRGVETDSADLDGRAGDLDSIAAVQATQAAALKETEARLAADRGLLMQEQFALNEAQGELADDRATFAADRADLDGRLLSIRNFGATVAREKSG